jgi:hypothetical protein
MFFSPFGFDRSPLLQDVRCNTDDNDVYGLDSTKRAQCRHTTARWKSEVHRPRSNQ